MRTDLTDLAITKAKIGNGWRPEVGVHPVDFVARIRGTITRHEDYDRAPTGSIPLLATLALFIHRMGATRDAAEKILVEAMTEALEAEQDGSLHIEEVEWVTETINRVKTNIIAKLPTVTVNGSVKANLTVDVLDI